MAVIDLKSAYTKGLTEIDLDKNKIADWEEVLTGLQSTYETAYEAEATPIKQQAAYDISQAYENYKKTQLNLLQNQQLGTGFREALGKDISKEYKTTYEGIRGEESSQLSTLASGYAKQYLKDYETQIQELQKEVDYLSTIDEAVLKFKGINTFAEAEKQGYYKQNEAGEYELTEKGKDLYSQVYLSTFTGDDEQVYTFGDWLRSNEEYGEEIADYYLANRAKVGELSAGFSAEEMSGTYDPYKYRSYITSPEKLQEKNAFNITVNDNAEYIYENLLSEEDRKKYDELTQSVAGLTVGMFDTSGEEYLENVDAQKKAILKKYEVVNNNPYGINIKDAKKAVSAIDVTATSFGDFAGTGKGTEQDKWLEELKRAAKNKEIPNGAVVDMNYGLGKKHNYVYYGGYWYPTDLPATYKDAKDTKGKLEKKK